MDPLLEPTPVKDTLSPKLRALIERQAGRDRSLKRQRDPSQRAPVSVPGPRDRTAPHAIPST